MKVLTVDIGTGTQDIFLYDSRLDMENGFKLVLPSPTMRIYHRIQQATQSSSSILLKGVTMGGGPSAWAVEAHIKAGFPVFATVQAAKTINDDLDKVTEMGITLVSDDEAADLSGSVERVEFKDFDYAAILQILSDFGVPLQDLAAVAVAVFDHGDAPPGISDRKFRFDYLDNRLRRRNDLRTFAFRAGEIPPHLTRMQAVVDSSSQMDIPLVLMDTGPAAILGATFDPRVSSHLEKMVANLGNFHSLAFRLGQGGIEGFFEHHTGFLNYQKMESLLLSLADGSLHNKKIFDDQGHGAKMVDHKPFPLEKGDFNLVVTGPRRNMFLPLRSPLNPDSDPPLLRPYFAVPFGDMMITGCFGLLAAVADLVPELSDPIISSLAGLPGAVQTPWD